MHPPEFRLAHYLSDWPNCHIEAQCSGCKRSTTVDAAAHAAARRHEGLRRGKADAVPEMPGVARAGIPLRLASPVFLLRAGSRLGAGTGAGAKARIDSLKAAARRLWRAMLDGASQGSAMLTVTVYQYTTHHPRSSIMRIAPRWATRSAIDKSQQGQTCRRPLERHRDRN